MAGRSLLIPRWRYRATPSYFGGALNQALRKADDSAEVRRTVCRPALRGPARCERQAVRGRAAKAQWCAGPTVVPSDALSRKRNRKHPEPARVSQTAGIGSWLFERTPGDYGPPHLFCAFRRCASIARKSSFGSHGPRRSATGNGAARLLLSQLSGQ